MNIMKTSIPDVALLTPKIFGDERGFFFESFNQRQFSQAIGRDITFVQDNHSCSVKGVLRGIHYQIQQPQGKLVRVVAGTVFDVAVDLRQTSPTFGQHVGEMLSADNKHMLWVPEGFGHAFLVLSDKAEFLYKTTDYYAPSAEQCIAWNDPTLAISWPLHLLGSSPVQLSQKDKLGKLLTQATLFETPEQPRQHFVVPAIDR
jgi:dTDP-4-dehydrorhamnose 3,5-epimerase